MNGLWLISPGAIQFSAVANGGLVTVPAIAPGPDGISQINVDPR